MPRKNRSKKIDIRLTPREYQILEMEFQISPFMNKSQFIRAKIFEKQIGEIHQRKHTAFLEAAKIYTEINRLGNNFNQLVHAVNTFKTVELTPSKFKIIQELGQGIRNMERFFEDLDM